MAAKRTPAAGTPPGLIASIDEAIADGELTHAATLELTTLRAKAAEVRNAITNFHNNVPPIVADALTRASQAL